MPTDVFEGWADRLLDGAREPSAVVRFALPRLQDEGVRRAAGYRCRQFTDTQLREAVPALLDLLAEETGVAPVAPGWRYRDGEGPWPRPASGDRAPDRPCGSALAACALLGRARDPRAAPLLVAVFARPEVPWEVRRDAGRALAAGGAPWLFDAAPACLAMAGTPTASPHDLRVLWQALRLLAAIGSPLGEPAVPALARMLHESRAMVLPPLAALALGAIGTPAARAALERIDREFTPGSAWWRQRDDVDRELLRRAACAGLGLAAVPEVADLDEASFLGCERRRHGWY